MRMSDWSSDVCSSDLNYGENNGTEGATDDPRIEAMRLRQIKNLLATLLLSRGVPMLLGGDEFRSEERRVGKECVRTCRSRWSPDHYKQKTGYMRDSAQKQSQRRNNGKSMHKII